MSDRIEVKIDEVLLVFSPLKMQQKLEMAAFTQTKKGIETVNNVEVLRTYLRHCLIELHGVEDMWGKPYKLERKSGVLTDNCIDEILGIGFIDKLAQAAMELIAKTPQDILDGNGEKIEGVTIEVKGGVKK